MYKGSVTKREVILQVCILQVCEKMSTSAQDIQSQLAFELLFTNVLFPCLQSVSSVTQEPLKRNHSPVIEVVVYLHLHPLTVASMFIFLPVSSTSSALSLVGCWPVQPLINPCFSPFFLFLLSPRFSYFNTVQQYVSR